MTSNRAERRLCDFPSWFRGYVFVPQRALIGPLLGVFYYLSFRRRPDVHKTQCPVTSGATTGGSSIRRFSSCTDVSSNSAALASEIAPFGKCPEREALETPRFSRLSSHPAPGRVEYATRGGVKSLNSRRNSVSLKIPRSLQRYVIALHARTEEFLQLEQLTPAD